MILDKNVLNKSFLFFSDEKNELSHKAIRPLITKLFFEAARVGGHFVFGCTEKPTLVGERQHQDIGSRGSQEPKTTFT